MINFWIFEPFLIIFRGLQSPSAKKYNRISWILIRCHLVKIRVQFQKFYLFHHFILLLFSFDYVMRVIFSYLTDRLPFSIRVLLESAVRNCDNFQITSGDVKKILDWETSHTNPDGVEVPFKPSRVILQVSWASNLLRNNA